MEENLADSLEQLAAKDNEELLQVLSSQELLDDAVVWVHKHQDGFQDAKEQRALATFKWMKAIAEQQLRGGSQQTSTVDELRTRLQDVIAIVRNATGDAMRHQHARAGWDTLDSKYDSQMRRLDQQQFAQVNRKIEDALRDTELAQGIAGRRARAPADGGPGHARGPHANEGEARHAEAGYVAERDERAPLTWGPVQAEAASAREGPSTIQPNPTPLQSALGIGTVLGGIYGNIRGRQT